MQLDMDTREQQWLSWLIIAKQSPEEIVHEAHQFIAEAGTNPPLIHWIATYGMLAGYERIIEAISNYLAPPALPPVVIPPPPTRVIHAPVASPRDELLDALIRQQLMVPQARAMPARQPFWYTLLCWILGIVVSFMIAFMVSRSIFKRDILNEVRILWARKAIPSFVLDADGKYLAWNAGAIVFYSHDYTCVPAFRAIDTQGHQLPPPSEWPEQDADKLLESEYYGCAPLGRYQQWGGYWGKSPWAEVAIMDQAWLIANGLSTKESPLKNGWPMWVEYQMAGVGKDDFQAIGGVDLQKKGAIGQTGLPTMVPLPTAAPVIPTQPPAPPVNPEPNEQPIDQQPAAPVDAEPAAPPAAAPVVDSTPPTAVPIPTVRPFATQTMAPALQPTIDLIAAAAVLHTAQTAQAGQSGQASSGGGGSWAPTPLGHLQAPQSTPNDVVRPAPCLECHH